MTAAPLEGIVTAATFVIDFPGTPVGRMDFSELGGINSKVASQEYLYSDATGKLVHTKQFGKTDPPTINLKRAVDKAGTNAILAWHELARTGSAAARADGTLSVYGPGGQTVATAVYIINGAWISEVSISSMKAGSSDVAMIDCKITCEKITGKK
jgi:tail tube protein gp19